MGKQQIRMRKRVSELQSRVVDLHLEQYFPASWFDRLGQRIDEWDGQSIFTLHENTFFISYMQDASGGQELLRTVRAALDELERQSPKAAAIRRRAGSLAGDTANAIGGLFELLVLHPLISAPNALVEYEPKIGSSDSRSEALVRVAGHNLYIEAAIFTKSDESFSKTGAFSFDPSQQELQEGSVLRGRIEEKARQYEHADKPAVLFIAEGTVTTGLALEGDPRTWAMNRVAAPGISAVAFAKDCFCGSVDLRTNQNAEHELPDPVRAWIENREDDWCASDS